jgi:hypothetical protein
VTAPLGISPVVKYAHSELNSLSPSFETICNAATTGQTRTTTTSAGLPIDQPVPDSLTTTSEHSCQLIVITGCPSEHAKEDTAPRLTSASTATKSRLNPICTTARPEKRGVIGFLSTSMDTSYRPKPQPTYAASSSRVSRAGF